MRWLSVLFGLWLAGMVVLPLLAVAQRALAEGPAAFLDAILHPEAQAALLLTAGLSLVVAALDVVLGLAVAWSLVRWEFPGRRWLSVLVDLPFAVPTLVAGVLLVALLGPQTALGRGLEAAGLPVVYAWPGMVLALCFVTLPFVVRAVEPVLRELDPAEQEAAEMMGASPGQVFLRVLLPPLVPALVIGGGQSFARAVGEFGAMAVISGNLPRETLVASVYILGEVEAGDATGAASVALVLLSLSWLAQLAGRHASRLLGAP